MGWEVAKVGGPDEGAEVVVDFKDNAALAGCGMGLDAAFGGGEVVGVGGAAYVDVIEVVGYQFATCTVAIVEIERVVAEHNAVGSAVVMLEIVEAVVFGASDVGRGL